MMTLSKYVYCCRCSLLISIFKAEKEKAAKAEALRKAADDLLKVVSMR